MKWFSSLFNKSKVKQTHENAIAYDSKSIQQLTE